ncbi:glycosyltransferase family 4 protein [Rahnella bonaserana]|jgi:glycosyltransferase involved in cell wall biosynthesis|uniref:Glycosyltransferase family 4 protein n=1 Tax=Rahnella bonaserana TaxID=2816248 RepID=A0ABS6LQ61_9GAMM|nr:glycosyltransferase family 4 protein [Rahnella bonaserana]MBU9854263.1 glycosyltransferase family 4 protein [Rahnella bonaserana]MCL9643177.1 glycosyltransferase family 4 protein [Rahnella victoriana]
MRKILIFTNEFYPFKGGIGRYCEELINVIKHDNQVTLIAPKYDDKLKQSDISKKMTLNLFSGGQFKYWHLPKLIKKVMSINFDEYDYVLVADWPFWIAIQCVNKFTLRNKIKFNLMLHGSEVLNLKNGKASIFAKMLNLFSGVKTIFTNSNYTKRILLENHHVPKEIPVIVTYLGVSQDEKISNETYLNNANSEQFNILTVGRLDDRKGYDYVIKSLGLLPPDVRKKIIYTIVGNGSDDFIENLKTLAERNDVRLMIRSGIGDEELKKIYQQNKVFVLAAKHSNKKIEGFGLVFLEAAIYGIPSVATDVGAISEVVLNNRNGLVVKEDIHEIAQAIMTLYKDRVLLSELSNNCISDVKKFTWSKLAELTLND